MKWEAAHPRDRGEFQCVASGAFVFGATPEATSSSVPRLRVLVIDDEPNVQGFLADLLVRKGAQGRYGV